MRLARKAQFIHNSSVRMMSALDLNRGSDSWKFMRREAWLHFGRSVKLL